MKKRLFRFGIFLFILEACYFQAVPQQYQSYIIVSQDGTGNFTSIQKAIESCKSFPYQRITIYIKNGVYHEKVRVPAWNTNLSFVGQSRDSTIISYGDYFKKINKGPHSTFYTATVMIQANDFQAKNLTIEGTTDFIFGEATALFDSCTIICKSNSFITAASTPENARFGFVFKKCNIEALPEVNKVYLGRPWRKFAKVVFINCTMGSFITPDGWKDWNNSKTTVFYAAYHSKGTGANPNKRVEWSHQLTKKQGKKYKEKNIFTTHKKIWIPF